MYTEEEAKGKQCLQQMIDNSAIGCIGPECMAWRWNQSPSRVLERSAVGLDDDGKRNGYCGLAGKP